VNTVHREIVGAALFVFVACADGNAQNVAKPYPAIFGGAAAAEPTKGPTLDFALQALDAYDDNLQADVAGAPSTSLVQASGSYAALAPSMNLGARAGGVHIGATASSNVRYYGDLRRVLVTGQSAAIGLDGELKRNTHVFVNQAMTYAPAYLYGLFAPVGALEPGTPIEPASDYTVDTGRSFAYATNAQLTHVVTTRLDLTAEAAYRRTDFVGNTPGYFDLRGYDAGASMRYAMSRNLKFRLAS
jgi:hypothetical protein